MGDEDLLEIIGNSKSVAKLQKHFKKMFAGVASVILSEDGNEVLGICSREGEQVSSEKPRIEKTKIILSRILIASLRSKHSSLNAVTQSNYMTGECKPHSRVL